MNINRLVYVFGEPVSQILTSITPTRLTKDVITQMQAADDVVNEILLKVSTPLPNLSSNRRTNIVSFLSSFSLQYELIRKLSQVPVVLFPSPLGGSKGSRSIAIRTFITNDFMTGVVRTSNHSSSSPTNCYFFSLFLLFCFL